MAQLYLTRDADGWPQFWHGKPKLCSDRSEFVVDMDNESELLLCGDSIKRLLRVKPGECVKVKIVAE